jgi:hypothetical protein
MAVNPDITFVLGTRPEIIKLAPVIRDCDWWGSLLNVGGIEPTRSISSAAIRQTNPGSTSSIRARSSGLPGVTKG